MTTRVKEILRWLAIAFAFAALPARAASELAVAIRYLQANGTSHSQIFLYREDGTLLRQLTKDNSGQMKQPVFAPDGATIVFTRELPSGAKDVWSIEPNGAHPHKLDPAPPWYTAAKNAPDFDDIELSTVSSTPQPTPDSPSLKPDGPDHYITPDNTQEVLIKVSGTDDETDGPGHGKHYQLRDLKTGKSVEMGNLPGFFGLFSILRLNSDPATVFLICPPLRIAFFDLHLDSTNGDTVFALDLKTPRLVRLSDNWAAPIPLPGEPDFLTSTEARYIPIPGSSKTANCSYLDRWDAHLNKIRYGRDTAAICYGASIYRPGMTPAIVNLLGSSQ
jgi:hypothetical protein